MHGDETPTPYAAPPSMMDANDKRNEAEGSPDQTATRAQQDMKPSGDSDQNRNNLAASNGSNHIGELPTKPRRNDDTSATQEESRRGFFGGRKKDTNDSSSSSEEDYFYQAGITTQNGDDDADTFVQFTLEAVKPSVERRTLGAVQENEETEKGTDPIKEMQQQTLQSLAEKLSPRLPKTELKSDEVLLTLPTKTFDHNMERPRLGAAGKPASRRNLVKQGSLRALLEKDKPSVDEEVQKLLNLKNRPGLGGRKQSDRGLLRDGVPERQLSKRNLMKKSVSERGLGLSSAPGMHKTSEHSMSTVTTDNSQAPLMKSNPKGSAQLSSQKKVRPANGDRNRLPNRTRSMQSVTEKVQNFGRRMAGFVPQEDSSTASFSQGETMLDAPSQPAHLLANHSANHPSIQT